MGNIISSVFGIIFECCMKQQNSSMDPNSSETVEDTSCSNEVVGIQNLPDEILLEVFKYFTHKEKQTELSLVCRHWEELASDPSLYQKLEFKHNQQPCTRMAVKLVKMAPWLVSLQIEIDRQDDADEILRHVGTETPRLKVLSLDWCNRRESQQTLKNLKKIFMNCSKIREICVQGCASDMVWTDVVENCKEVEAIKSFVLSDNDLLMICKTYRHSLIVLDIGDCRGINASMIEVSQCANMTTLHLRHAYIVSEVSLIAIGDMPNLVDLEISHAKHMTTEGWLRLFRKPILKILTKLKLCSFHGLDGDVARAIMKNAKVLNRLTFMFGGISTLTCEEVGHLTSHLHLDTLLICFAGPPINAHNGVFAIEVITF